MKHTITLDDMEITALNILLEGESEIMVESRLNTTGNVNPDRREILLNLDSTIISLSPSNRILSFHDRLS